MLPHHLPVEKIESVRKERGLIIGFKEKRSLSPQDRTQSPGKQQLTGEQLRQQQASRAAALIEMVSGFDEGLDLMRASFAAYYAHGTC
ncbi:hypothetical protein EON64_09635 [archaeon]|nr:MAG: hypothetical protein EON64_09635 [archaeon]